MAKNCRRKGEGKRKNDGEQQNKKKKKKKEQTNQVHNDNSSNEGSSNVQANIAYNNQPIAFIVDESDTEDYNFDTFNSNDVMANDDRLSFYDWLGDTATTSHIANSKQSFSTFTPLSKMAVSGVGNVTALAEGKGTVELESNVDGQMYNLKLKNVLYIPSNNQNLISLGRWDNSGGHYTGGGGKIILVTKDGKQVAKGRKVNNNLYKMDLSVRHINQTTTVTTPNIFIAQESLQSWEIWHRRLGHIGYTTLQHMLNKNLVDGFLVNEQTPKPDCRACTEAKQTHKPFGEKSKRKTEPGELTHTDLWGPYPTASINGNSYYISFVDDTTKIGKVEFLKQKSQANQEVKNHLTHLKALGKNPNAL